jgi:mono/diheme cytochrome c family protein
MLRPQRLISVSLIAFALAWFVGVGWTSRGVNTDATVVHASGQPAVVDHMKEHFNKVEEVQAAIVRGDIEGAKTPASWIAEHQTTEGLPEKSHSQIEAMKTAAKRAAEAKDIRMAANAAATMASTCGTCHRSTGASPNLPEPPAPAQTTGLAGQMRAHDLAVDYLYQGLVAPSDEKWKKGADLLKESPLAKDELPGDAKLTEDIKAYEVKVKQYAQLARSAQDTKTRVGVYGELLAGCAECHSLYGKVLGPRLQKP